MNGFKKKLSLSAVLLSAFALWTVIVRYVDVQPVGPQDSSVGLATINHFVHQLTGVHFSLYTLTDWLSLIPVGICAGFALLGLTQWIRRKSLRHIDPDLFVLGAFYVCVAAAFLLFEKIIINYRPVLIEGILEASYPSSTTLMVMCVMLTAALQLRSRIRNSTLRKVLLSACMLFTAFMVIGRLISGVHWLTDIVGGGLLSAGLVSLYCAACNLVHAK